MSKKILISVILFLIFGTASGQTEGDRVIAVVGNDIITTSDLQYQVQNYARQNQLSEISPYLVQQIFQSMLTNKILLAKAEQDSIMAEPDEVDRELDQRINALIGQAGSKERLEELYGMTLPRIKYLMQDELEKSIKIDKLKRKKFQSGISVTDKEVRDFYNTYRDSLPDVSDEFELEHIFIERKVTEAEKSEGRRIAGEILDSIKKGFDFSELARRNSQDSISALAGGDLGFAKRGTYVKEFEEAVFNLKPGEVSDIVETQFGFHIIKVNEKKDDKVRSQHILIRYPRLDTTDIETVNFLNDIKARIEKGELTFEEAAKQYSQDPSTSKNGGYLGKIPYEQLDSNRLEYLKNLSAGEISQPVETGNGTYEIYKLINFIPGHKLNLKDDYYRIKKIVESYKEDQEMKKWLGDISESIYVDIRK